MESSACWLELFYLYSYMERGDLHNITLFETFLLIGLISLITLKCAWIQEFTIVGRKKTPNEITHRMLKKATGDLRVLS